MNKSRILDLREFVDEIYEDSKKNEDSKYIFFLGAGCSVSSGIKLASGLAKEWYEELKKQNSKFNKFNTERNIDFTKEESIDFGRYYFEIFETLFPTPLAQQKEIQRITEEKVPSLGYYVLSALMQLSQFNTVITTNFDNLIQDALIYSGNKRALVITHQDLAKFIERNNTPLITKIHGDAHLHPFNNADDTKAIPELLKESIRNLFENAKVIFIGYKGNDESITDLLKACKKIDQVYWCSSSEPIDSKLKGWWEKLVNKTHITERDFDKIMNLIQKKFSIKKPDFQKRFQELETKYHEAEKQEIDQFEKESDKTYIDYLILGNTYYSRQEYQKAIDSYQKASELNLKDKDIFNNWGLALMYLAKQTNDGELYKKAFEILNKAIELGEKSYNLACWYAVQNKKTDALELLAKCLQNKEIEVEFVENDDDWTGLKNDDNFRNILENN